MWKMWQRKIKFLLIFINLFCVGLLKPTLPTSENQNLSLLLENILETKEKQIDAESDLQEIGFQSDLREIKRLSNETKSVTDNEINSSDVKYNDRVEYAKKMLSFMNQTVDPCDDFYEYACGNWKNVIVEHDAKHKRNNLLDIAYKHYEIVENLFQDSLDDLSPELQEDLKMAQLHYQSCLNAELFPFQRSEVYLEIIEKIGGFPAVNKSWNSSNFNWFNMSSHMTNYGSEGFIKEEIFPNHPFPPYFELPEIGFDSIIHEDTIASKDSRAYKLNEKRILYYLKAYEVDEVESLQIVEEIFDFWKAVLNVTERYSNDAELCKLLNINSTGLFEDWNNHLAIAWNGIEFDVPFDDCPCHELYIQLDEVCNKHKRAAANYLALKFLFNMDARLKDKKFQKEHCIKTVFLTFGQLIDKIYIEKYFDKGIQIELKGIITEVRKILRELLEEADWLDEKTRNEALKKEDLLKIQLGRFEDSFITEMIIKQLKNITFSTDSFDKNNLELRKMRKSIKRFNGLHYDIIDVETKPLELLLGLQVNSFYYNIDNSIYVMAGVLHPPAYHKSWPNALKFGTIGYLLGHEFTHGFDTAGSNYDSTGSENNWWTQKSAEVFKKRANCYTDHYSSYLIPEINRNVNGNQTKDESIADAGGLREALKAYYNVMEKLKKESDNELFHKEEQMPGMNMSPEQLFFLGFAQLWCSAYKEEHYWEELRNEHPIDRYRVVGAVTNLNEFSKAYNCSLGSKMNPNTDKCSLW